MFYQKSFSVIELMMAVFILVVAFIGFYQVAVFSFTTLEEAKNEMKADYLAEEYIEAVRSIRDQVDWDDPVDGETGLGEIDTANTYYLIISGGSWEITTVGPGLIDNLFSREIIFENISRDPDTGDIEDVYNVSNKDDNSLKVKAKINWLEKGETKDLILATLITNF
ncbi:MAG: hypothetical protein WBC21_02355 [Minisyncoccales bacterium]